MIIYVCGLLDLASHIRAVNPSHLVSLVTDEEQPATPAGMLVERHLRVVIHDINEPLDGHILADAQHIAGLISFVRTWPDTQAPMLIHCMAGISRSMAAALIALVTKAGGRELEAAERLRRAAPHAFPNRRMIALADELLRCEGRLIAAREAMGPPRLTLSGPLVELPLLR
ncbi:MAG TPA: protein-tyrosine phosphatase family protein [Geminicoccaceae bacterium]|nr:protein-tyrosine phosphatase family protein [Geminicoccaceae bacterium]